MTAPPTDNPRAARAADIRRSGQELLLPDPAPPALTSAKAPAASVSPRDLLALIWS